MSAGTTYMDLIFSVSESISIYDGGEIFLTQFNAAPVVPRTLFAAYWCDFEVCNGGFKQFFSNSTGVLAPEAVAALREIGMPKIAAVVEKAMAWFGATYPREKFTRREMLSAFESNQPIGRSPFDEFDHEFYELVGTEGGGFEALAVRYAGMK